MLYNRFVIGEETLSSTSVFSFSHPAIFCTATKSFVFVLVIGHYRQLRHEDITSVWRKHQGKSETGIAGPRRRQTAKWIAEAKRVSRS